MEHDLKGHSHEKSGYSYSSSVHALGLHKLRSAKTFKIFLIVPLKAVMPPQPSYFPYFPKSGPLLAQAGVKMFLRTAIEAVEMEFSRIFSSAWSPNKLVSFPSGP
jgi:hypothetical protein